MNKPVYLDYAATTPVDPDVVRVMKEALTFDGCFGNPASSTHFYGWQAKEAVDKARDQLADLIGCEAKDLVWTSGATEANNLAIKGVATARSGRGKHIITCQSEHKAVLDPCEYLESQGFEVTYLKPKKNGLLDLNDFKTALREDTILVSIMWVNNETGVVQDVKAIGEICRQKRIVFHVDAAQAVGKFELNTSQMPIDLMSIASHKFYGPKGIGALYVCPKPRTKLVAQIHGGGHERRMRSGTLPTHQIVGIGQAAKVAAECLSTEVIQLRSLKNKLISGITSQLDGVEVNGDLKHSVPGIVNLSFVGVDGEALIMALHRLAISTGSACTSATIAPSHVLTSMGISDTLAHGSLRFSVGRFTTDEDIDFAINEVVIQVKKLREISPLSE